MKKFLFALIGTLLLGSCVMEQSSPIAFEWVDLNQDGFIVFDEYYYYMTSRIEATPPFDIQSQWYQADANRDGIVTRQEQWSRLFPVKTVYRARPGF
jgi:Ca2+-binding EF-hand superfamily protein